MKGWAALMALLGGAAWAEAPELTIYALGYPPMAMRYENGRIHGSVADLVSLALRRAGLTGHFEMLPWRREQQRVQDNRYSCLIPMARTKEREARYRWVAEVAHDRAGMYAVPGRKVQLRAMDDARRYRVGVLLGSHLSMWLLQQRVDFYELPTVDAGYQALRDDMIDLWAVHDDVATYLDQQRPARSPPLQKLLSFEDTHFYLACNKQLPDEAAARLSKAVNALWRDGAAMQLQLKYGVELDEKSPRAGASDKER